VETIVLSDSVVHTFFDRSRAMRFDFPLRKGSGISQLIPNCSAPSLSLLYQMLTYDPEERIGARAALQHIFFRELR
jgi:serine/threonine protein kinase